MEATVHLEFAKPSLPITGLWEREGKKFNSLGWTPSTMFGEHFHWHRQCSSPANTIPKVKHGGGNLMLLGCSSAAQTEKLVKNKRRMNAAFQSYFASDPDFLRVLQESNFKFAYIYKIHSNTSLKTLSRS